MPTESGGRGTVKLPRAIPQDKGETQQRVAISYPCWSIRCRSEVILDILAPESSLWNAAARGKPPLYMKEQTQRTVVNVLGN